MTLHMDAPQDSIYLVPHLLGYRPRNAIVVVGLAHEMRETPAALEGAKQFQPGLGPVLRINLDEMPLTDEVAKTVCAFIVDFDISRISIDWFGRDLDDMLRDRERLGVISRIGSEAKALLGGLYGHDEQRVLSTATDGVGWFSVEQAAEAVSGREADPYVGTWEELGQSRLAAELVWRGSSVLDAEPRGLRDRVPAAQREEVRTKFLRILADESASIDAWEEALAELPFGDGGLESMGGPDRVAELLAGLQTFAIRDRVITWAVSPEMPTDLDCSDDDLDEWLTQATEHRPDRSRIHRVSELLADLAQYSLDVDPAPYAVYSYLAWWTGSGSDAARGLERALASDASYSLANLVDRALEVQLPPPWVDAPATDEAQAANV